MMRTQFPLRLAYCMSFNKSQGQTLQRVLMDITTPPFSHGHLYVALSRVTLYSNIHIVCDSTQIFDGVPFATNTTYPELLDVNEYPEDHEDRDGTDEDYNNDIMIESSVPWEDYQTVKYNIMIE